MPRSNTVSDTPQTCPRQSAHQADDVPVQARDRVVQTTASMSQDLDLLGHSSAALEIESKKQDRAVESARKELETIQTRLTEPSGSELTSAALQEYWSGL